MGKSNHQWQENNSLINSVEKNLLRGETCRAVLPALGSNIFLSDIRVGLIDSSGMVHGDYPLQSVTDFRFEKKTLSAVLHLSVVGASERKLGSVSLKLDVEAFKKELDDARQNPEGLYLELADQYANAFGERDAGKSKKDSKNRNLMLGLPRCFRTVGPLKMRVSLKERTACPPHVDVSPRSSKTSYVGR